MTNDPMRGLLAERKQLRKLLQDLTLAKGRSESDKIAEIEEQILSLFDSPLNLARRERPGAPHLTAIMQAVFARTFTFADYENPLQVLQRLPLDASYPLQIQQRILDLVGPFDLAAVTKN